MRYGLQTHFGTPIGEEMCWDIAARKFTLARIDAQTVSTDVMRQMVAEVARTGMTPYVTVARYEQIEALPYGNCMCEWRNEPDLDINLYVPPADYAKEFKEACRVAARSPVGVIGGPVASNLNRRGCDYLEAVIAHCGGALPSNAVGVMHRYGHNRFSTPHKLSKWNPLGPFHSREDELRWFKDTIGCGRPWGISEGGWASAEGTSEEKQARLMHNEFTLHSNEGADFYVWYQLNDGPGWASIDHFGIRRIDGTWKPAADVIAYL